MVCIAWHKVQFRLSPSRKGDPGVCRSFVQRRVAAALAR
jgi:hypothetical protein